MSGLRRVVLVTGLSGAGKASSLRVLEDLGYEAVDNPPLPLMEEMVLRGERPAAICVDARSRGFDPAAILATLDRLKRNPALHTELVYLSADEIVLQRRFTETRRRHPLAPTSRVADGIAAEIRLTSQLRAAADLVLDTTDLPLPMLRRLIEQRFAGDAAAGPGMTVSLTSFAYPSGLPREADLVFDARFLRNPHYDPMLRDLTGLDAEVAAYVEADPDFAPFLDKMTELLTLLLPRFVQEGKKYASVAIGCTGGRHRSVRSVEVLAERLRDLRPRQPGRTGAGGEASGDGRAAPVGSGGSADAIGTGGISAPHLSGEVEFGDADHVITDGSAEHAVSDGSLDQAILDGGGLWRVAITHRELMRAQSAATTSAVPAREDGRIQAQEA